MFDLLSKHEISHKQEVLAAEEEEDVEGVTPAGNAVAERERERWGENKVEESVLHSTFAGQ